MNSLTILYKYSVMNNMMPHYNIFSNHINVPSNVDIKTIAMMDWRIHD